jgi:prepilin-type N-terminal cleavage/methylation domain-containing protein
MCKTIKIAKRRGAFTLVEMLVVIGIILVLAALAAAFAPRITDSTNLSRAVDNLEQWLLTAKMRAKRDGLATGIRFMQAQGDVAGTYSQFQYIQQPDPLSGGWWTSSGPVGAVLTSASNGTVTFSGIDFSLGLPSSTDAYRRWQWLVQAGDYLEVRDGGVYLIGNVTSGTTLTLTNLTSGSYDASLSISSPGTTNFRILRQARFLLGEEPLVLPNNFAVDMRQVGNVSPSTIQSNYLNPAGWNQTSITGPSYNYDIVFSPTGAVVGANASNGLVTFLVYDLTMDPYDSNRAGVIGVQTRTGFIGAYSVYSTANPFYFAQIARESGL